MISIKILLENSTLSNKYLNAHGLSILIKTENKNILLDTGPNSFFAKNASKMKIDLEEIDTLIFSHCHCDHTNGLNTFCKINKNAKILMCDTEKNSFYSKHKFLKINIGIKAKNKNLRRITFIKTPYQIDKKIFFIPCTVHDYGMPLKNERLFVKTNRDFLQDNFSHEGILVIEDEGELVIFNSCSHNGVINSIESVRKFFPGKKVKSYIGGFHFPYRKDEKIHPIDIRNLEELIEYANILPEITFFTGHCTFPKVSEYLENKLGKKRVKKIYTGLQVKI